ncbi:MAG: VOC family protein [Gammaproteobacteria bacterium]|nr:VOC family protein [Gammaproteobacteria bacterium]
MTPEGQVTGGVLDVMVGVPDLVSAIAYWELFGYRVGDIGQLDAQGAQRLYGVPSACRAVRMWHQQADHGLVRLVQWSSPTGRGLELAPFRVRGGRWTAGMVKQLGRMLAHAKYLRQQGGDIRIHAPDFVPAQPGHTPFRRPIPGVVEMALAQPLSRQVLFERADVDHPLYGTIHRGSMFEASQFTHFCLVIQGADDTSLSFYDETLGLRRTGDFELPWEDIGTSGKDILGLAEGEGFRLVKFDDPRSDPLGAGKRSGRVTLFNFSPDIDMPDYRAHTTPGALGYTTYSLRMLGLETACRRVEEAGGTVHSAPVANEFGERAVLCDAPDGSTWCLLEAADSTPVNC